MAVKKAPSAPKYMRGMMTLEAIDAFFEIVKWDALPEDEREYEEDGPVVPECLKLIQKLHEEDPAPGAPAPAAPAAAPAPAPPAPAQPQQPQAGGADEEYKRGYDLGWHHKHRGESGQLSGQHSAEYTKGFQHGFEQGGDAMTVRDNIGKSPEGNKAANAAAAGLLGKPFGHAADATKHYDRMARNVTGPAIRAGLPKPDTKNYEHPHQPGQDVVGHWAQHEGKGVGYTPAARSVRNFYDKVKTNENDADPNKVNPSEFASHLDQSAMIHTPEYVTRVHRGLKSGTGTRKGKSEPEGGAPEAGVEPGKQPQVPSGRPARAGARPRRVVTGGSKEPETPSPVDTAPAPEPEEGGLTPEKTHDIHSAMHDVIEKHPEFESKPGEFDRRAFLKHYISGEHRNPAEILRKMGYPGNGPEKNMPNLILRGLNSRGKQVGKGFHGVMREHPVSAGLNAQPEESFNAFVARIYGINLTESTGWFNDEAAHDLFGQWLMRLARSAKQG